MVETIVVLLGCCWLIYKSYQGKDSRRLFSATLLLSYLFSRWPLHLPLKLSLALMAFCATAFLLYEHFHKKTEKNTYLFVFLYIVFGVFFLVEVFFPANN